MSDRDHNCGVLDLARMPHAPAHCAEIAENTTRILTVKTRHELRHLLIEVIGGALLFDRVHHAVPAFAKLKDPHRGV
jgi:hypothetical protein